MYLSVTGVCVYTLDSRLFAMQGGIPFFSIRMHA